MTATADEAASQALVLRQMNDVMRDQLGGHVINQAEGPNGSVFEIWVLDEGNFVMTQLWPNGGGWDYYLQGKTSQVDKIADSIKDYFSTTR